MTIIRILIVLYLCCMLECVTTVNTTRRKAPLAGRASLSLPETCQDEVKWHFETPPHKNLYVGKCHRGRCSVEEAFKKRFGLNPIDGGLIIEPVEYADGGSYVCRCGNNTVGVVILEVIVNTVNAYKGDETKLPMYIKHYKQTDNIQCTKDDKKLLQHENGTITIEKSATGRVSMSLDRLREGDMSIKIERLSMEDTGMYKCSVNDDVYHAYLNVTERPHQPQNRWDIVSFVFIGLFVSCVCALCVILITCEVILRPRRWCATPATPPAPVRVTVPSQETEPFNNKNTSSVVYHDDESPL